jgi:hypothetical protein
MAMSKSYQMSKKIAPFTITEEQEAVGTSLMMKT